MEVSSDNVYVTLPFLDLGVILEIALYLAYLSYFTAVRLWSLSDISSTGKPWAFSALSV